MHPALLPNRFTLKATVHDSAPLPTALAFSHVHKLFSFCFIFFLFFPPNMFRLEAHNKRINKQVVILVQKRVS